jgi:hypothetical protein
LTLVTNNEKQFLRARCLREQNGAV